MWHWHRLKIINQIS